MYPEEKALFIEKLKEFAATLTERISTDGDWDIRGFIDIFKHIYTISTDTKVISKILELHLFPHILAFSKEIGYSVELATCQNWYPDITFICDENPDIKFAVDLKTTYRDEDHEGFCNGFTLGSHGEYFSDRTSTKNIQYPYGDYSGHFCLGIIYSRAEIEQIEETRAYGLDELTDIPAVIHNFLFFAEEKWKIASDKGGSGNTANIGSIAYIEDILSGNGVFAKVGESIFDEYWINFGELRVPDKKKGGYKRLSTLSEYLEFKRLPSSLNNPKKQKRKGEKE